MKKALIILLTPIIVGLALNVQAAPMENLCENPPVIARIAVTPQDIWAPAGKDVELTITGYVLSRGCEAAAYYTLETDNGYVRGSISLAPNGSFAEKVTVHVSKDGKDKDGTVYNGMIFAYNQSRKRDAVIKRNRTAVTRALENLKDSAIAGRNLMMPMLDCVREYATVGEISDVLRDVYGEFKEKNIF